MKQFDLNTNKLTDPTRGTSQTNVNNQSNQNNPAELINFNTNLIILADYISSYIMYLNSLNFF